MSTQALPPFVLPPLPKPPKSAKRKRKAKEDKFPDLPPPDGFPDISFVKIGPYDFRLRFIGDSEKDACNYWGYCCRDTHVIGLARSMNKFQLAEVAAHEILHAAHFLMSGLSDKVGKEEDMVQRMGVALTMIVRDNPKLSKWWLSLLL